MVLYGGQKMNWKHVKTLLLVLLVAVNALLGYFIYTSYSSAAFTDTLTAERAASILKKSGIEADSALLSVKNDSAQRYTASYNREEYLLSLAAFLLGRSPDGVYLLPSGIRAETTGGEIIYANSDLSVSFALTDADREAAQRAVPVTDTEEAKNARIALASLLGYSEDAFDSVTVRKSGECVIMTITQTEGGIPLYGFDCTFGMRDGRIVYAEGKHFFGVAEEGDNEPLLNRVNILLSERKRQKSGKVLSIELCYIPYEDSENQQLHLAPAYAVSYADGSVSVVNAISSALFSSKQ